MSRKGRPTTGAIDQIPRAAMPVLLAAACAALAGHLAHLPLPVVGLAVACLGWRLAIHAGRVGRVPRWVKGVLVPLGVLAVLLGNGTLIGVESAVAVLAVAFSLKILEATSRRDGCVVVFLAWFVAATRFLFSQTLAVTALQLVAVVLVAAALVALHLPGEGRRLRASMVPAVRLCLQAVPLAVVVFLLFPRVGPLWSVPQPASARTGVSDDVTPGDIARLGQSDALAFRASFPGPIPAPEALYWRGLVYTEFVDGTWSQGTAPARAERLVVRAGEPLPAGWRAPPEAGRTAGVPYTVTLEPTGQPWLFTLDVPVRFGPEALLARDWRLLARTPVIARTAYSVVSDGSGRLDPQLPRWLRDRSLALPPDDDPRTRALARTWRDAAHDDADIVRAAIDHFARGGFGYTLSPPVLPRQDSVDAFLFESRRGFCAHFAGAFVVLMRAAGVPARMVGGYQGGQVHADAGFVTVRQYDAHAWAEVWLDGGGWQRVDPTALVAPDRVAQGMGGLRAENLGEVGMLSSLRLRRFAPVAALQDWFERVEFRWNLWVLGYDANVQLATLRGWFGDRFGRIDAVRLGLMLAVVVAMALVGLGGWMAWRAPAERRSPAARALHVLVVASAPAGLGPQRGEPPGAWAARLERIDTPLAVRLAGLVRHIEAVLYHPAVRAPPDLRTRVHALRLRLWFARTREEGRA